MFLDKTWNLLLFTLHEAVVQGCLLKKGVRKNFANWLRPANFIKNETATQTFSREFCEIFKYTFFTEHVEWLYLNFEKLN